MRQLQKTVTGSLADVAGKTGGSIAEAFLSANFIILVDTSISMGQCDARGGQERYKVACQELATLQERLPGKIAVISFSSTVLFCPSGVPDNLHGGTDLAGALRYVQLADGLVDKFVIISDGEPHSEDEALQEAAKFTTPIDCMFVGPEGGAGAAFLARLASRQGGQSVASNRVAQLADNVQRLLLAS